MLTLLGACSSDDEIYGDYMRMQNEIAADDEALFDLDDPARDKIWDMTVERWRILRRLYESLATESATHSGRARERMVEIDRRIMVIDAERNYAARVVIQQVVGAHRSGYRVGTLTGEVRNTGAFSICALRVKAFLLDGDGVRVQEEKHWVVPPTPSAPSKVLKPNYVASFQLLIETPPLSWSEKADVEVEAVRLCRAES